MFDLNQPIETRDGHAVVVVRTFHGIIVGYVRCHDGANIKRLWDADNGRRLDAFGLDKHDLVNQTEAPLTDEYIDYWADEYIRRRLHDQGVLLDTFLQYPHAICKAFDGREHRPLLPEQRRVYHDLVGGEAVGYEAGLLPDDARLHGNGYSQRLKHNRYDISRERTSKCA